MPFSKETKIPLLDGQQRSLEELSKRDKPFCVYTCKQNGDITCAYATAKLVKENAELIKVTLDNNKEITCTPDIRFVLTDGTHLNAKDICSCIFYDQYLRQFTLKSLHKYFAIQQWKFSSLMKIHHLVEESGLLGERPIFDNQITEIHHKDFNRYNNDPSNLQFIGDKDHRLLHKDRYPRIYSVFEINMHRIIIAGNAIESIEKPETKLKKVAKMGVRHLSALYINRQHELRMKMNSNKDNDGNKDVYTLIVEGYDTFAISAGVFVKTQPKD